MKKIFRKSNIFSFILGALIFGSIAGVTAYTISAKDVGYTPKDTTWKVNNVSDAIDDLKINKANGGEGVEVARLTTQSATYTMQNDGYIIGKATRTNDSSARLYINDKDILLAPWDEDNWYNVSVYAPKDSLVRTREYGLYDLTVYEWK